MGRSLLLLCVFVLFTTLSGSFAVTIKPVDDSNSSAKVVVAVEQVGEGDARLDRKVTYEARHRSVSAILADLSEMSGVTLKAGMNSNDWQVRDRKMNIFAKDIPLSELLSSIARVMKFKWIINHKADPWTYRLFLDRKTLLGADAEAYRSQDAFDREVMRRRKNLVDTIMNLDDNPSPDDLAKLRQENPYLYLLQTRGAGKLFKSLFKEVPGLVETFIRKDDNMVVDISKVSPETQDLLLTAMQNKWQLKGYKWGGNGAPFPDFVQEKLVSEGEMAFELKPRELSWEKDQQWDFGGLGVFVGGRFFHVVNLQEPSSPLVQQIADSELQAYEKDVSVQDVWKATKSTYDKLRLNEVKSLEKIMPSEPEVEHPDEPWLHSKVKMKVDGSKLVDFEAALASVSGFAVVSDSFRVTQGAASVSESETELKGVLTAITDGFRYNWDKRGGVLELRSKDWFRKRTTQIPDAWLDEWKADAKKNGYVPLDDWTEIALLTNPQIEENVKTDEVLGQGDVFSWTFIDARPSMRFYAALTSSQRVSLFGEMGLPVKSLSPEQYQLLARMFKNVPAQWEDKQTVLRGELNAADKSHADSTFRCFDLNDGKELWKWIIALPKYQEPPKAQQGVKPLGQPDY